MTAEQPVVPGDAFGRSRRQRLVDTTFESLYRFEAFRRLWLASLAYTLG